jgi:hypothetical protein
VDVVDLLPHHRFVQDHFCMYALLSELVLAFLFMRGFGKVQGP